MRSFDPDNPLSGLRVLVAEDEILIAINLEETFREAGADVVSASTLGTALSGAADQSLSAAVLDVRLGSQTTEAIAELLHRRNIPFLFYTGQQLPDSMRQKFPNVTVLVKPIRQRAFVEALLRIVPAR